jgi:hypothetical protein
MFTEYYLQMLRLSRVEKLAITVESKHNGLSLRSGVNCKHPFGQLSLEAILLFAKYLILDGVLIGLLCSVHNAIRYF